MTILIVIQDSIAQRRMETAFVQKSRNKENHVLLFLKMLNGFPIKNVDSWVFASTRNANNYFPFLKDQTLD